MSGFLARGGASLGDTRPPAAWAANGTRSQKHDLTATTSSVTHDEDGRKYYIPGTTFHVPNAKDVAGRSYTRTTKRALNKDVHDILAGDAIPSAPHATHKPRIADPGLATTVIGVESATPHHVPGYSGHVPGVKEAPLGVSFSKYTKTVMTRNVDHKEDRKTLNGAMRADLGVAGEPRPKPRLTVPDTGLELRYTSP